MAIVYLLHFADPGRYGRHYLGAAEAESAIDLRRIPHGAGFRQPQAGAVLADVWEAQDLEDAGELRAMLRQQGPRSRLCSVCTPGNRRGLGRWPRETETED